MLTLIIPGALLVLFLALLLGTLPVVTSVLTSNLAMTSTPQGYGDSGTITIAPLNETSNLTASTSPPVTAVSSFQQAGSGTIDLTALPDINGGVTTTFSGLKVQHAKFTNPSTNANNITVTFGASTAYLLLGSAWKFILAPGQSVLINGNNATPTVSGSLKNIDVTATGVQPLSVELAAG